MTRISYLLFPSAEPLMTMRLDHWGATQCHDPTPPTPPPVTATQVTVPDTLVMILQSLIDQQRSFAEQQHHSKETQTQILAEQARQ